MAISFSHEVVISKAIKKKFPLLKMWTTGTSENGLILSANNTTSCRGGFTNCLSFTEQPTPHLEMGEATAISGCIDERGCRFCVRAAIDENVKSLLKV